MMKVFWTLLVLAGLSIANVADAQGQPRIWVDQPRTWSEWETSAIERRGPDHAPAVLLYFHGRAPWDVTKKPVMGILVELAKAAGWDVLRINRNFRFDIEEFDDDILRFVSDRVTELRRDGYKQVIVGGGSGGGWLSLLASVLPGVDAVLAFAPGTRSGRMELLRTARKLGRVLAGAKAKRIAVFFFAGDFLEELEVRRSFMIRPGLEESGSTFMIVDHPPDLYGHEALSMGRLARRYRDCLLQLVNDTDLSAGEIRCSPSTGYAVGSDIGFPTSLVRLRPPADASPALRPYLGRWEGDNEWGTYFIVEAMGIGPNYLLLAVGASPLMATGNAPWWGIYRFQLAGSDGSIFYGPEMGYFVSMKLTGPTELELTYQVTDRDGHVRTARHLLRKRLESTTAQATDSTQSAGPT